MNVLDKGVSFPMALIWRKDDFYILIYDENTPSRSW